MRLGLIALGDSITNGDGEPALGVPPRSWALWLAQALGMPYTNLAEDGALLADVIERQLPRVTAQYDVACLFAGVNDVRGLGWDGERFAAGLDAAVVTLGEHARRVLLPTIPLDLGRPRAGEGKVSAANAAIRAAAQRRGATTVPLEDLRGAPMLLPDAVHPTAVGQLEIADRALRAMGGGGEPPSQRRPPAQGRRARARFTARWCVLLGRDLARRGAERVRPPAA